jgi:exonuclease I
LQKNCTNDRRNGCRGTRNTIRRGQDPLVALKQQEINIKAEDLERKAAMDAGRLGIDQQKIQQNAKLTREKIDSQEDIAQLRANVT